MGQSPSHSSATHSRLSSDHATLDASSPSVEGAGNSSFASSSFSRFPRFPRRTGRLLNETRERTPQPLAAGYATRRRQSMSHLRTFRRWRPFSTLRGPNPQPDVTDLPPDATHEHIHTDEPPHHLSPSVLQQPLLASSNVPINIPSALSEPAIAGPEIPTLCDRQEPVLLPTTSPSLSVADGPLASGSSTSNGNSNAIAATNTSSANEAAHTMSPQSGTSGSPSRVAPPRGGAASAPLGTLVVVQGVVHTADVSPLSGTTEEESAVSSVEASPLPFRVPRTPRLPSLFRSRRPISSPPSAITPGFTLTDNILPNAQLYSSSSESRTNRARDGTSATTEPGTLVGAPIELGEEGPSDAPPTVPLMSSSSAPGNGENSRERETSLAMSSIEVLGTLLSVATAATAASLVTGSTDGIFSDQRTADPIHVSSTDRNATARADAGSPGQLNRPSRFRGWDGVRDRISRVRTSDGIGSHAGISLALPIATPVSSNSSPPTDARDTMVREMQRAFSAGLGIGMPTPSSDSALRQIPVQTRTGAEEPSGQSFQHFLLDLQTDLRAALIQSYSPDTAPPVPSPPRNSSVLYPATDDATLSMDESTSPSRSSDAELRTDGDIVRPRVSGYGARGLNNVQGNGNGQIHEGGINWWRLFRFPIMDIRQAPLRNRRTAAESQESSSVPSLATTDSNSNLPSSSVTQQDDVPRPDDVVPVIIVGLQSLESESDTAQTGQRTNPEIGVESTQANQRREVPREAPQSSIHVGGRTYLIFVIGGYYPPGHSIVTGDADMDSFEALLDLADILGQAKSTVATKDEIAHAGLEVLKPASLARYLQEGKVASNTVERCLICLDNYEQDEDLRLLQCRHAFHKACVDRWLECGRNNCPACRSPGVKSASSA
ncbi:hypothetical protein SISSUDRAFT_1049562 [Sistotremastrum suecicum HHB10207 ss-3]|uniref:RING-type E3 ubiquitin transferase n=1 Tax=Sistotremastrum suecicum HHB10207 ss-3 TaxID=1314776 RepID=A0A166BQA6_9AGAM|nr:hypothetical protein SISSUDRAFT_1049562 [Sistotremastrum suecicum HHB10207 ss-3]